RVTLRRVASSRPATVPATAAAAAIPLPTRNRRRAGPRGGPWSSGSGRKVKEEPVPGSEAAGGTGRSGGGSVFGAGRSGPGPGWGRGRGGGAARPVRGPGWGGGRAGGALGGLAAAVSRASVNAPAAAPARVGQR